MLETDDGYCSISHPFTVPWLLTFYLHQVTVKAVKCLTVIFCRLYLIMSPLFSDLFCMFFKMQLCAIHPRLETISLALNHYSSECLCNFTPGMKGL